VWSNLAGCGEAGNYTNGSGDAACVSSDMFGPHAFDAELRTPTLSLAGLTGTTLNFTANYGNFGGPDFFDVDVRVGGGPWTNELSWNEDHGGFFAAPGEDVVINLSAYDGMTDVRVRFRYYDPNPGADWDWYVQIDDVTITGTPFDCTLTAGISNGSFETGDFSHWCIQDLDDPYDPLGVVADGTFGFGGFFQSNATDGAFLARHGFDGDGPGTISLKQQVTIPATAAKADLTFDYRGAWAMFGPLTSINRTLDVVVEPAGGGAPLATTNILTTDFAATPFVPDTGQKSASVSLLPYAGSSALVGLVSTIPESWTGPANMDIDNVALSINNRPAVTAPIADIVVPALSPNTVIQLSTVFTELDGEAMTFSATSSNPSLVKATVGSPLTLDYQSGNTGTATVTATATDPNGFSASDVFTVTVTQPPAVLPTTLVEHDVGLVEGDSWKLRDHKTGAVRTITFGVPGDVPIMGDWNCNGIETPALFRQTKPPGEPTLPEGLAYYRNDNQGGVQNGQFRFVLGNPGDIPLAGDFNGDGCDSLSVYRPAEQRFYIADKLPPPIPLNQPLQAFNADRTYIFGVAGDKPFVGDFNGDGIETVGLHRESTGLIYYLNTHPTGSPPADVQYVYGDPGDRLVAGDWVVVDGKWSPALYRSSNATFYFRDDNAVSFKPAAASFPFGNPGSIGIPVSGVMGL